MISAFSCTDAFQIRLICTKW